jgi:predicted dehydrogenase
MTPLTRRTFLKTSAIATAGVAFSARSWGQVTGANSDIRVAVVGVNDKGGRGGAHLNSLAKIPGVRIVAICDVDSGVLERVQKKLAANGTQVKTYVDVRELLTSPDVDAVTIATPNHWHALGAIWACQAGKDVYVEKPVSHNVWEGRQLVAAAKKYNRAVQCGTQIRSGDGLREAVEWVRAGNIGRITASRGFCYKRRDSIGKTEGPQAVPAEVNYDLWSGPAPLTPPRRNSAKKGPIHYDWHWFWNYGNGDIGNQGIHQMDVARWFLGETNLPRHTFSIGGRLGYEDDGETPNTQVVIHDYKTAPLIFEVRGLPPMPVAGKAAAADSDTPTVAIPGVTPAPTAPGANTAGRYRGVTVGNVIDCEGGYVIVPSYTTAFAYDHEGKLLKEFKGSDNHMANFISVVRSRKMADLRGQIEEGHISSALCHVGNISHRLGQIAPAGMIMEKVKGDGLLAEAYGRMVEHLAINGVDLNKTRATVGAPLAINAKKEVFTGQFAAAGNPLLTREYRAPFVVPKVV